MYVQGQPKLLLSWDVSQGVYQLYETVLLCLNHLSKIIWPRDTRVHVLSLKNADPAVSQGRREAQATFCWHGRNVDVQREIPEML